MRITVKVKPGAKISKVTAGSDGSYTVFTHARAHDGEANKAVIEAMAKYLGVAKTSIKLVRGAKSREKVIEV